MKFSPAKIISIILLVLFCGTLVVEVQAQGQRQRQRWLLIFSTSSAMKKRLPAVEAEIKTLFFSNFTGKISKGDSVGVWMVGDKLKSGGYPLISWSSANTPEWITNLISYVHAQKFSGSANLSTLQPILGQVVESSERLTVLIFCDGTEQIDWSPYDGINGTMHQMAAERKKSQQPVIVVLRSARGKFIGGMVNFPPVPLILPSFPLPAGEETQPAGAADNAASNPPPPVVVAPVPLKPAASLFIVGTHVSTNESDMTNSVPPPPVAPATPIVPVTPVTPVPAAAPKTNLSVTPVIPVMPVVIKTNPSAPVPATNPAPLIVKTPVADTNQPAAATSPDDHIERILTVGGIGLLIAAAGLVVFLLRRKNASHGSLITSSMQDHFRPPDRK